MLREGELNDHISRYLFYGKNILIANCHVHMFEHPVHAAPGPTPVVSNRVSLVENSTANSSNCSTD